MMGVGDGKEVHHHLLANELVEFWLGLVITLCLLGNTVSTQLL
jgi:hypothetical protein